jgi:hypothetical protein
MNESGPEILLYPNPAAENYIIVSYSGDQETSYRLINIAGFKIEEGILLPGINQVQFENNLRPGFYFIQVESPREISRKFIVK